MRSQARQNLQTEKNQALNTGNTAWSLLTLRYMSEWPVMQDALHALDSVNPGEELMNWCLSMLEN